MSPNGELQTYIRYREIKSEKTVRHTYDKFDRMMGDQYNNAICTADDRGSIFCEYRSDCI